MGSYLGKPAVALNRKLYNAQQEYLLTSTSVFGNLENELRSIPKVKITLDKNYDASSRKLILKVNISPLSASNGDFRLHACITEDKNN